jgi:hypothetical protein
MKPSSFVPTPAVLLGEPVVSDLLLQRPHQIAAFFSDLVFKEAYLKARRVSFL